MLGALRTSGGGERVEGTVTTSNFVENFDIKPWFEQLSSIRDAKQKTEQAEQGGGFSLFD